MTGKQSTTTTTQQQQTTRTAATTKIKKRRRSRREKNNWTEKQTQSTGEHQIEVERGVSRRGGSRYRTYSRWWWWWWWRPDEGGGKTRAWVRALLRKRRPRNNFPLDNRPTVPPSLYGTDAVIVVLPPPIFPILLVVYHSLRREREPSKPSVRPGETHSRPATSSSTVSWAWSLLNFDFDSDFSHYTCRSIFLTIKLTWPLLIGKYWLFFWLMFVLSLVLVCVLDFGTGRRWRHLTLSSGLETGFMHGRSNERSMYSSSKSP